MAQKKPRAKKKRAKKKRAKGTTSPRSKSRSAAPKKAAPKKAAPKKAAKKKKAQEKRTQKKSAQQKTARRTAAKKKGTPKKGTAKKGTAKKGTAKKGTAKKGTAKKGTAKQAASRTNSARAKARKPAKAAKAASPKPAVDADTLAKRQKDISVSEFFTKNRHLLGFDSPTRALLTTVREAVDNSLDACEETGIAPEIEVRLVRIREDRYRVQVGDNGPGIVKAQLAKIFGRLLYGSKFHSLKQSRGQQGIGISAAGMYGYITTGQPVCVISRTGPRRPAHEVHLIIDTAKNRPIVVKSRETQVEFKRGTSVEIELEASYKKGKHSVDAYLEQVSLANPHVKLVFYPPGSEERVVYERVTQELPEPPKEITPHPHGVELGVLMEMLERTEARTLKSFLVNSFSRVTARVVEAILQEVERVGPPISAQARPRRVGRKEVERLHTAIARTPIMAPPTNCLSPIGAELIEKALRRNLHPDFVECVTRSPAVYRGNPFQVEVGVAYGGDLPADDLATLYRFANRVPLQYEQAGCAMTRAIVTSPWKNYEVQQARGALPSGPIAVLVHIASVWVPFTSESKKAVAHYDEIIKEMRLALMEVGRKLSTHLKRRRRQAEAHRKHAYIESYIPQIGIALQDILELSDNQRTRVEKRLSDQLRRSRKV